MVHRGGRGLAGFHSFQVFLMEGGDLSPWGENGGSRCSQSFQKLLSVSRAAERARSRGKRMCEGARQRGFRDARRSKPQQKRTLQASSVSAFAEHMRGPRSNAPKRGLPTPSFGRRTQLSHCFKRKKKPSRIALSHRDFYSNGSVLYLYCPKTVAVSHVWLLKGKRKCGWKKKWFHSKEHLQRTVVWFPAST